MHQYCHLVIDDVADIADGADEVGLFLDVAIEISSMSTALDLRGMNVMGGSSKSTSTCSSSSESVIPKISSLNIFSEEAQIGQEVEWWKMAS